ncbi:GNAT family N-acetyltransferase [Flavitalea sp.]|nr:GNAT family N-acetyltransferase [Flavitalea sp.]
MALEIHPLGKEDLHLLPALQPEGWGSIMPAHVMYLKSSCCFPLKFTNDDKLVGIGTTIVHHDSAWLAHIIVHPAERQKGIGQLITKTLMDVALSRHCDLLSLIATDLGEPVYTGLGFKTDTEYLFFKEVRFKETGFKEARPKPLPEQPGNLKQPDNIEPYQPAFKAELLALDKHVSGEERTVYLQDHLDQGMVYFNNEVLEGFYLPAAGEGIISAGTSSAGIALMEFRIKTKDVCIFPVDNINARQYFERNHFEPFRTAKRMVFGKKRTWHPELIYNRIGGNLG